MKYLRWFGKVVRPYGFPLTMMILSHVVLAGCAILEAIRRHWPSERLRVADRGLREGMLSELMADDGVWRRNRREVFSR